MPRYVVLAVCAIVAMAVPAGAVAKPTKHDKQNAAKECKLLRGTTDETHEAFKAKYRNFGACVSEKAREEAAQRREAKRNAARDCRQERNLDPAAFTEKYGKNHNKHNAFGKCVSAKAHEALQAANREDRQEISEQKNAAKECGEERDLDPAAFAGKYGTNHNKHNAFGKCVSAKSDDNDDQESADDDDQNGSGEHPGDEGSAS